MAAVLPILVVLLAGVGVAVQSPTNAQLARSLHSVTLASLISFLVGTAALATIWLATDRTAPSMRGVPAWAWVGGLYGAGFVAALAWATPRLGLAVALTLAVASQLATALVVDQWGLLGLERTPVSATRIAGVALVLAGVLLVRRG